MMNRKEHEKNAGQRSVLTRVRDRFSVRNLKRVLAGTVALLMAVLVAGMATPAQADEPVSTFTSTWNTTRTSTGSSTATQISLPLVSTGEYDFTVDWGDSTTPDNITTWNSPLATHTYTASGDKTIEITGLIKGFSFDNAGDRLKLTDISDWGPLELGNNGGYFSGAEYLNISASGAPANLAETTNMSNAFRNASLLTADLSGWDVSEITNMRSMFEGASLFNSDIHGWNVGKVTTMRSMFQGAAAFNADIKDWAVGNVTTMRSMFQGAAAFDRNLGAWDVSNVVDMTSMFAGGASVGLSLDNYDALLEGWAQLPVQPGVDFDAGTSYYNPTTSLTARNVLRVDNQWTITDAGAAAKPNAPGTPTAVAGSESATVSWSAPSDNHSAITSYTVTSSPGSFTCTATAPALNLCCHGADQQHGVPLLGHGDERREHL